MSTAIFYVILIGGFMGYGIASILRPDTLRRFNTPTLLRTALPIKNQIIFSRIVGTVSIIFSLFILAMVVRDLVKGKL